VQAPILAVVEAKKEDIVGGLGQCRPRWWAFGCSTNAKQRRYSKAYGCVTSGNIWRFPKLEGSKLFIDRFEYYPANVAKIVGILVSIARG
jgi:hypothetical protein